MRSPNKSVRLDQAGFSLIEVLTASLVLSVFITAVGASWVIADRRVGALILRQKAIFAASSEVERLTALYNTTSFGALGPVTSTGYDGPAFLPTTRLIYPTPLTPYSGGPASDFTTSSLATFKSSAGLQIYVSAQLLPALNREYLWLDQPRGVMARVSWTATGISPAACVVGGDSCPCLGPLLGLPAQCQRLSLYLEYPYRFSGGTPTAGTNLRTVVVSTIVGNHT